MTKSGQSLQVRAIASITTLNLLEGSLSLAAQLAVAAYRRMPPSLESLAKPCGSGKEAIDRDFYEDVHLATAFDVSDCVPTRIDGAYTRGKKALPTLN